MKSALAASPGVAALRSALGWYGLALLALWGVFVLNQRYHWGWESYYNYGWTVPVVGLALIYLRWRDVPAPGPLSPTLRRILPGVIVLGLLVLFPLRLMNEVNVFWRVPFLLQSWTLLLISWAVLLLLGGRRWLGHFGFACFFLLTMVPWPYRIEIQVIQNLTAFVTASAVELMRLMGYPAEVRGNTIQIGSHWLGVDEACSGIRSLQALTMVALWLGEYFRLRLRGRLLVIVLGVFLTGIFNLLRATGLTLFTVHGGQESYERWHDPLGFITFIASILILYFACEWLGGKVEGLRGETPKRGLGARLSGRGPRWLAGVMILGAIAQPLATDAWFAYREREEPLRPDWTLQLDYASPHVEQRPIPKEVSKILNFDYGQRAVYGLGLGRMLEVYYYGHTGNDKMASVASYGHRPDICMTAAGARQVGSGSILEVEIDDELTLPLEHFIFESTDEDGNLYPIQVFWLVWERRNYGVEASRLDSLDYGTQFEMLWKGRRDYARKVILVSVLDEDSEIRARRDVRRFLSEFLVRVPTGEEASAGR